jgi:hypothetical protein
MTVEQPLTPQRFIERFFGEGNQLDLGNPHIAQALQPWIRRVLERKDRVLLPRQENGKVTWYALTNTARNARAFREELLAAVGTTYTDFRGVGAKLRPSDPVESAILDFSGRHVFKLVVVASDLKDPCNRALERMLNIHDIRPPSQILTSRAPGIILRDLELALQQRDRKGADDAIEELRVGGHLDGQNLLFLNIRRWEAFAEWAAIYNEMKEGTILELHRPARITQALMRALYQVELVTFEKGVRASQALEHFQEALPVCIASLLETREGMSAPEVTKLFMLKAAARQDPLLRDSVMEGATLQGTDKVYLRALADLVRSSGRTPSPESDEAIEAYLDGDKDRAFNLLLEGHGGGRRMGLLLRCASDLGTLRVAQVALEEVEKLPLVEQAAIKSDPKIARQLQKLEERYTAPEVGVPKNWFDWMSMVSGGSLDDNKAAELALQGAEEWSLEELLARPGDIIKLSEAMLGVTDQGKQQLRYALPHLQRFLFSGDGIAPPLKPLLQSLLELYVFDEERSGATWCATTEVLEELVRCGLSEEEYSDAVDYLGLILDDGLPLNKVDDVLDLLEALVLLVPGNAVTMRAAALVQGGLQRWWERLGRTRVELFNQLGRELGTGASLPLPKEDEREDHEASGFGWLKNKIVALYSLNERALVRVKSILEHTVESVRVLTFKDKVGGGNALREAARSADIFLVVTGAAKHAATEFIEANRGEGLMTLHSHGKGSASMLRLLSEEDR